MRPVSDLPSGNVTFLLTDVEGSTKLWENDPQAMSRALARHDAIVSGAVTSHGGYLINPRGEGDSSFSVFEKAIDAMGCALGLQLAICEEQWPGNAPIAVRIALHTGDAQIRDGNYYGPSVNRCARLRSIAHGGQTLLSRAAYEMVSSVLPDRASVIDLGIHRLKDIATPERVYQLVHPDLISMFPPLVSVDLPTRELPIPLTSFVGRTDEMERVGAQLRTTRLLTLTGSGGCGKTRLALEIGAKIADRYDGGIHLIELAPLTTAAGVLPAIAAVLGSGLVDSVPAEDSLRLRGARRDELVPAIAEAALGRKMLLVLDNCEHLVESAAEAAELLISEAPSITIMATSREPLGIGGEVTFRVPSLSLPGPEITRTESLVEYEAIRLFVDRATLSKPGFSITNANASAVVDICRQLDGIPLAIELAAARAGILTPDQLAQRLNDRFRLLVGGSRTAQPRQQTLRAAVDWSYDLLSPEERSLFARLAVFPGTFDLEAAETIGTGPDQLDVLTYLGQLIDKSLVASDSMDESIRYGMLNTIRAFALERLEAGGEVAAVRASHLNWFASLARRADPWLQGAVPQPAWLEMIDVDHDNFIAALEWAATSDGDAEEGLSLAVGLWRFWLVRGQLTEGRQLVQRALDAAPGAAEELRGRALNALGTMAGQQGELGKATELHVAALEIGIKADSKEIMVNAHHGIANIAFMQARYDDARADYEDALAVARADGNTTMMAKMLHNLGAIARMLNDLDTARSYSEESLAIGRELGDTNAISRTLHNLADIARAQGDLSRAKNLFEESLELARRLGYKQVVAASLGSLGNIAMGQRDTATARQRYEESLAIATETGDRQMEALSLNNLGTVAQQAGDEIDAVQLQEHALNIARELGDKRITAAALLVLGQLSRSAGDLDRSFLLLDEALSLRSEAGDDAGIRDCLASMAGVWLDRGDASRAAVLLSAATSGRQEGTQVTDSFDDEMRKADLTRCREVLGEDALADATSKGSTIPLDDVVVLARGNAKFA